MVVTKGFVHILDKFERAIGQKVNKTKSVFVVS